MKWRQQLRFSAGFWFFLIAVALLIWGRHLPWPLKYLRYALWPYVAVAIMLMRLAGFDALNRAFEAGPHMLFISAFSIGPYIAFYIFASFVIVSYVAGRIYTILTARIIDILNRHKGVDATKQCHEPTPENVELATPFSIKAATTANYSKAARVVAILVFAACIVANIRGDASTRRKGSVSFTPLHVTAWKHGWPLPWLVQDMWPEESQLIRESKHTSSPITHRWSLSNCVNRTINGDASWNIYSAAIDLFDAVFLSVAVGMGVERLSSLIHWLKTMHSRKPTNEQLLS